MAKETSIIDIFNRMSYSDCEAEKTDGKKIRELYPDLEKFGEIKWESLKTEIHRVATTRPRKPTSDERALILLDIGRELSEEANKLSGLQNFREKDYFLLIDFFNYYSSLCYKLPEIDSSYRDEYVFIVLSSDVPFFILGSILSAAFGAGRPVVVLYSIKDPWFLLFLQKVFSRTMLPGHFFKFEPNCNDNKKYLEETLHEKIVFLGDRLSARDFYENCLFTKFRFVNLNNTAAIIFELCDLHTVIDKIFRETWDKKFATVWGVSTAVVQESVYQKFLDLLESRIDQITDEQERALIKNCIILVEDQNREMESNGPVLKVLPCRTANEGVDFLNSYQYYLGTSIWSENSSQALEVASKLICKNVWINCHGIIEPSVPFQSSDNNGCVVFGGLEGISEYIFDFPTNEIQNITNIPENIPEKRQVEESVQSAQKAFNKWLLMENKGMYLTKIAESFKNHLELSYISKEVIHVLSTEKTNSTVSKSYNKNFYTIHEKFPIGVIALTTDEFINLGDLARLITIAIASGNAVVVTVTIKLVTLIGPFVEVFNIHLPRGLLNVIFEEDYTTRILLESNKIVQAIWKCDDSPSLYPYPHLKKKRPLATLKRHCFISDWVEIVDSFIYQRECLSNKIIWLPKVDHFP